MRYTDRPHSLLLARTNVPYTRCARTTTWLFGRTRRQAVGFAAAEMGAGRAHKGDAIDTPCFIDASAARGFWGDVERKA